MSVKDKQRIDLDAVREKLRGKSGQKYWRSLEEVAETEQFQQFLEDEFPNRSSIMQINRRDLLRFMGASLALAGLSGCRSVFMPVDKVVPYVKQPEELVEGVPLFYATTLVRGGYGTGVLVEQHEGRPTKIEGNLLHPASNGALDSMSQAEILSLYDPDRAVGPTNRLSFGLAHAGDVSTWSAFFSDSRKILEKQKAVQGSGIRILTGAVTSPTLASTIQDFQKTYPSAKWHSYEPVGRDNVTDGTRLAFGSPYSVVYDFSKAKVIVSLDSDFLNPAEEPGALKYARDFADGRRVTGTEGTMNRLYVIESTPSMTGLSADHRWPVKSGDIHSVASAFAESLEVPGVTGSVNLKDLPAIVRDLKANRGASVVVAGPQQPPAVHALAFAINNALGNIGTTVKFTKPVEANVALNASTLKDLVGDLNANKVEFLLILGGNPVYDAPADYLFESALSKAKFRAHFGLIEDETSAFCDWHLAASHTLECWGDSRAFDGTVGLQQPLMAPIWDTKSDIELLSGLLGRDGNGYDIVRSQWQTRGFAGVSPSTGKPTDAFEKAWRTAVHDGVIKNSELAVSPVKLAMAMLPAPTVSKGTELIFKVDPKIYDGRYANNGWLQELPHPVTKLTWDNAAIMSPDMAKGLGVQDDDMVRVSAGERQMNLPVFIQPGHPNNSVTVHLGYGRLAGGKVATPNLDQNGKYNEELATSDGGGFNAYLLRTSNATAFTSVEIAKVGGTVYNLSTTQGHQPLEGKGDKVLDDRDIIREGTLVEFLKNPKSLIPSHAPDPEEIKEQNLYPERIFDWNGPQWGMTVDLNTCIGCNACVTACQSENNIPVVGKLQVLRHREMHWIRIDRYYSGEDENPSSTYQPVMCVQCEKAPCEPVCPVAATVHSHEGLNQMVYNRCVGTRYCSNNCPYKVRRFNYLNYSDNQPNFTDKIAPFAGISGGNASERRLPGPIHTPRKQGVELLKMISNPDVTVRGRGIMEKCTYCVQRINTARIDAKKEGRDIRDGEIVTACQSACPTKTIVFGNIADKTSEVSKLREDPRSYLLLEELQTRPRTSHLAKLRNPNPEIEVKTTKTEAKA